jgi:protein-L-isoaspartate(D-aspartate) O-methyltransferase
MNITVTIFFIFIFFAFPPQDYRKQREKMVSDQIEERGIRDQHVLRAMREVERHWFVPENNRSNSYEDRPLGIGYGQTISQPYIVAYMTEMLKLQSNSRVLEIGTGSGYQAAVLAKIVKEVYTIEIVSQLGDSAAARLKRLGYKNVSVKNADGYHGWNENSPFDAIMVTAAAEFIPPPLIQQLKEGGRMIIPIGSPYLTQWLMLVEKKNGKMTTKRLIPVSFVPFTRKND